MKIKPAGNLSVTLTLTATSGPLLVTITVQVITSPNLGFLLETNLTTTKSALGWEVVLFVPLVLFPGVSPVTLATLMIVLFVTLTIV